MVGNCAVKPCTPCSGRNRTCEVPFWMSLLSKNPCRSQAASSSSCHWRDGCASTAGRRTSSSATRTMGVARGSRPMLSAFSRRSGLRLVASCRSSRMEPPPGASPSTSPPEDGGASSQARNHSTRSSLPRASSGGGPSPKSFSSCSRASLPSQGAAGSPARPAPAAARASCAAPCLISTACARLSPACEAIASYALRKPAWFGASKGPGSSSSSL
mmetsp:Transcript_79754/g.247351  ORF Transcript_79754/g.247351 Transcript_79754/m.247351 type:complete len:215 (-) Transcript_79754:996-1640(-)